MAKYQLTKAQALNNSQSILPAKTVWIAEYSLYLSVLPTAAAYSSLRRRTGFYTHVLSAREVIGSRRDRCPDYPMESVAIGASETVPLNIFPLDKLKSHMTSSRNPAEALQPFTGILELSSREVKNYPMIFKWKLATANLQQGMTMAWDSFPRIRKATVDQIPASGKMRARLSFCSSWWLTFLFEKETYRLIKKMKSGAPDLPGRTAMVHGEGKRIKIQFLRIT